MQDEELVDPLAHTDDLAIEGALRPRDLGEFVAWVERMNADMLAAGELDGAVGVHGVEVAVVADEEEVGGLSDLRGVVRRRRVAVAGAAGPGHGSQGIVLGVRV